MGSGPGTELSMGMANFGIGATEITGTGIGFQRANAFPGYLVIATWDARPSIPSICFKRLLRKKVSRTYK